MLVSNVHMQMRRCCDDIVYKSTGAAAGPVKHRRAREARVLAHEIPLVAPLEIDHTPGRRRHRQLHFFFAQHTVTMVSTHDTE